MNHAIPFFADIPIKAIPAVQQLFDEAQAPGYSLPIVYSNLVSRLNSTGVTPPARKLVSQWLAAVKIGMASRPEMPAGITGPDPALAPTPGYFENLPEAAMPALTAAWDSIQASAGTDTEEDADERAFDVFFDAMLAIGHIEPSWRGFVAYAKAVRFGHIKRPDQRVAVEAPAIEPPAPEVASPQGSAEPKRRARRVKADVLVIDPVAGQVIQPEVVAEIDPETREVVSAKFLYGEAMDAMMGEVAQIAETPATVEAPPVPALAALKTAAGRLLDEIVVQLTVNIEQAAREATARMLREVADEMELGEA